jgi:hypothetical protein
MQGDAEDLFYLGTPPPVYGMINRQINNWDDKQANKQSTN